MDISTCLTQNKHESFWLWIPIFALEKIPTQTDWLSRPWSPRRRLWFMLPSSDTHSHTVIWQELHWPDPKCCVYSGAQIIMTLKTERVWIRFWLGTPFPAGYSNQSWQGGTPQNESWELWSLLGWVPFFLCVISWLIGLDTEMKEKKVLPWLLQRLKALHRMSGWTKSVHQ